MYEKDKDKKESKLNETVVNILAFLLMVVGSAWIIVTLILFFLVPVCLIEGRFTEALYSFCGLAVCVSGIVLFILRAHMQAVKKEEEKRAENVTEYTADCGRLGMRTFEYDKRYRKSTMQGGLYPIFSEDENAKLVFYGTREDGRLVEKIVDRLEADRVVITEGVMNKFEKYRRKKESKGEALKDETVYGIVLADVEIEIKNREITCEFELMGISADLWVSARFAPDTNGYRFEVED